MRALLLGAMGVITSVYPTFLLQAMTYVLAGYLLFNGLLCVIGSLNGRRSSAAPPFLIIGCPLLIFGVLSVSCFRYLVSILPVFLGLLVLAEGIVYLAVSICTESRYRTLPIVISLIIIAGGPVVILITFGGLLTLSRIFAILLLLSCIFELTVWLVTHRNAS